MADYRLKMMLPAQRSKGRSAVAMAAYRSAERLTDERLGNVHDYERRSGVTFSEIVTPEFLPLPEWVQDRGAFWNRVEASETRKNSQVAREIQLSLPHELSEAGRQEIALDFAQHVADRYGIGVDVNIHAPSAEGDPRNHHAHLMLTTRQLDSENETGFGAKVRTLDGISERQAKREGDEIVHLREIWRDQQNRALEREDVRDERGELVQVDHRSYERQGIDREGTEHEGHVATAIKRRGGESDVVSANDNIRQRNAEKDQLTQQIEDSREAIAEELQAVHRTPDEDKIKFKFRDDETVQGILAEQEAARRGDVHREEFVFMGGGGLTPHLFRAGHSRKLAEFNALGKEDEGDETGEEQREMHSAAPRRVDAEEAEQAWQSYKRGTALSVDETERAKWSATQRRVDQEEIEQVWKSYERGTTPTVDATERTKWSEAQRRVDREEQERELRAYENATREDASERGNGQEGEGRGDFLQELADARRERETLLDTDPRPDDFAPQIEPEPEREGYSHRW